MGNGMARLPVLRRPPEWGVEPVPDAARQLRTFDLFVLWSSLGVGLLVLAAGTLLISVFGLTIAESLVISIVGSVIGSLMLAAAAHHGSRAGVPTMVSLRPVLGRLGSYVPTALNVLQLLGWAAFELLVMGIATSIIVTGAFNPIIAAASIPLFGLVVLALAFGGPLAVVRQWLKKFAIWLVYLSTALIAIGLAVRGVDLGARPAPLAFDPPWSYLLALDLVIVMPISWWPLVADYNRFARRPRDSAVGTVAGYAMANTIFYVLGAALVVLGPDFIGSIGLLGLGFLPVFFILLDETDNAFANVYSTAVSMQNLAPRRRQLWFLITATGIAMAGALVLLWRGQGFGGAYELFLIAIGGVFVPLLGVVIADALVLRRASHRAAEFFEAAPRIRWSSILSWASGGLLYFSVYFQFVSGFPPIGATLPSFGLAVGLQVVLAFAESAWTRRAAITRGST
jgi:putative hydroxymethylpyrimidine transporter CytX